jgi:hypothetical protein
VGLEGISKHRASLVAHHGPLVVGRSYIYMMRVPSSLAAWKMAAKAFAFLQNLIIQALSIMLDIYIIA